MRVDFSLRLSRCEGFCLSYRLLIRIIWISRVFVWVVESFKLRWIEGHKTMIRSGYLQLCLVIGSLFFVSNSQAETAVSLNCKIIDLVIIQVTEGRAEEYSSYKNGPTEGDAVVFTIGEMERGTGFSPKYALSHDTGVITEFFLGTVEETDWLDKPKRYEYGDQLIYTSGPAKISFSSNYILIDTPGYGVVRLSRYYKSDWEGIATKDIFPGLAGEILSLNCQKGIGSIDLVYDRLWNELDSALKVQ